MTKMERKKSKDLFPSFYLYDSFREALHVCPSNKNEVAPTKQKVGGKTYFPLRLKKTNFVEKARKEKK